MKKTILFVLFMLVPVLTYGYVGISCGHCGGNMPLNIMGAGVAETEEFRFKLGYSLMSMDGLKHGNDNVTETSLLGMPAMGKFMAVPTSMDMKMKSLVAGYSFSDNFFGGVMLMRSESEMDMLFNAPMKAMFGKGYTMESHGMADTMVMTKYRLYTDDSLVPSKQVSFMFNLNLPTGSINEKNKEHPNPVMSRRQLPYGMQLGSGTVDPTFGILYQGYYSPFWWGLNGQYTWRFYDNERKYRLGDEFKADAYVMYQASPSVVTHLQLNGKIKGKIDGTMYGGVSESANMSPLWDTDSYGGESVNLTMGLQWQPVSHNIIELTAGVPLYQDVDGTQLSQNYHVGLVWYKELMTNKSRRYKGDGKSRLGF